MGWKPFSEREAAGAAEPHAGEARVCEQSSQLSSAGRKAAPPLFDTQLLSQMQQNSYCSGEEEKDDRVPLFGLRKVGDNK